MAISNLNSNIFNDTMVNQVESLFPFIRELAQLDSAIALATTCIHGSGVRCMDTRMMKTLLDVGNNKLTEFNEDINCFKNEIDLGRKLIFFYVGLTPTIYRPEELEMIPFKGILLRYNRYQQ
jgi:hypothetical protein